MEAIEFILLITTYALIIFVVIILPIIATIILGGFLATKLGLTGITWWAFMFLFYLIVTGVLTRLRT